MTTFQTWMDLTAPYCPLLWGPQEVVQARELVGCSQSELARRLGCQRQRVWRWETGKQPITQIDAMAIRFAVVYADLF